MFYLACAAFSLSTLICWCTAVVSKSNNHRYALLYRAGCVPPLEEQRVYIPSLSDLESSSDSESSESSEDFETSNLKSSTSIVLSRSLVHASGVIDEPRYTEPATPEPARPAATSESTIGPDEYVIIY